MWRIIVHAGLTGRRGAHAGGAAARPTSHFAGCPEFMRALKASEVPAAPRTAAPTSKQLMHEKLDSVFLGHLPLRSMCGVSPFARTTTRHGTRLDSLRFRLN